MFVPFPVIIPDTVFTYPFLESRIVWLDTEEPGPLTEVPEPEEPSESLLSGIEGISGTFSSFTVTAEEA